MKMFAFLLADKIESSDWFKNFWKLKEDLSPSKYLLMDVNFQYNKTGIVCLSEGHLTGNSDEWISSCN